MNGLWSWSFIQQTLIKTHSSAMFLKKKETNKAQLAPSLKKTNTIVLWKTFLILLARYEQSGNKNVGLKILSLVPS